MTYTANPAEFIIIGTDVLVTLYKPKSEETYEALARAIAFTGDDKRVWFSLIGSQRKVVCVYVDGIGWIAERSDTP